MSLKRVAALVGLTGAMGSALVLTSCGGGSGSGGPTINPTKFTTRIDNPYFPLVPGTTFFYEGFKDNSTLTDQFAVTSQTKVIQGVTTRVVHDKVFVDGKLEEDTLDWFAQDDKGNVWYFGEATKELDANGQVIGTKGSFEAGVNGAQAGIQMKAAPQVGDTYYQEFDKGNAEDQATVIDLNSTATTPAGTFTKCLKTKEFTALEPGNQEQKYYARGVGFVLGIVVQGGKEQLALKRIVKP